MVMPQSCLGLTFSKVRRVAGQWQGQASHPETLPRLLSDPPTVSGPCFGRAGSWGSSRRRLHVGTLLSSGLLPSGTAREKQESAEIKADTHPAGLPNPKVLFKTMVRAAVLFFAVVSKFTVPALWVAGPWPSTPRGQAGKMGCMTMQWSGCEEDREGEGPCYGRRSWDKPWREA